MKAAAETYTTPLTALRSPGKALDFLRNVLHLVATAAPWQVLLMYVAEPFTRGSMQPFRAAQSDFRASLSSLRVSRDWFIPSVPYWLSTFHEYRLDAKPRLRGLEIGSWEGLSSAFMLRALPNLRLTCVDTWEGSDENRGEEALQHIERRFDFNLCAYQARLTKYKGTSFSYFDRVKEDGKFDLIYVDGSHHCDDVLLDAIKAFERLEVGGIMIFDDYLWRLYPRANDNPAAAINAFLRLKKGQYRPVRVYAQVIIEKTAESRHA
jgi:predicted O-methyltransferase YrrM